ncbi:uncharacterized protein LOC106011282 [Aplysia californica]|uniref:Uncharacterized protein LOC106011282 n=1 Tax=Aplysia californica TaxID=6500 RepID=A0ABM0ZWA3_APLCA|nr:uncharacterized protein LOC106011282 [Aplysia californica]
MLLSYFASGLTLAFLNRTRTTESPMMASTLCTSIFFIAFIIVTTATSEQKWAREVLYGDTANLTCESHHFRPAQFRDAHFQWMFPNGEVVNPNSPPLDKHYSFNANGSILLVHDVDRDDFGLYFCLVSLPPNMLVHVAVRLGLNVNGPFYGDLNEKYQPRLKVGLFAGLVVFVVMSMLCFNLDQTQHRLDRPNTGSSKNKRRSPSYEEEMYQVNTAFQADEEKPVGIQLENQADQSDQITFSEEKVEVEPKTSF